MVHGENSTVVSYELKKDNHPESPKNLWLEIRPLIAFRDYHSTTHENGAISAAVDENPGLATVTPYQGLPSLHLAHNASELREAGDWYRNLEYDAERERGLDFSEDLFNPCVLRFDLCLRRQASVISSMEKLDAADIAGYRQAAVTRQRNAVVSSPIENGFAQTLAAAADQC
jgi:predicted glycogen debranching enzyme